MKFEQNNNCKKAKTKRYGFILSDTSKTTDYPESGMSPNCRVFGYEFAPRGDHFEVVYSYFREGDRVEIFWTDSHKILLQAALGYTVSCEDCPKTTKFYLRIEDAIDAWNMTK